MKEVWIAGLKFWRFPFSFYPLVFVSIEKIHQALEIVFHRLFKPPRMFWKMLRCASCFQFSSWCLDIPMKHCLVSDISSPGQKESQKDANWKLRSTCYSAVWRGLACTCVDLRGLEFTLVEIKFARKSTQVLHRLATQPKSTQVEWRPLTYY